PAADSMGPNIAITTGEDKGDGFYHAAKALVPDLKHLGSIGIKKALRIGLRSDNPAREIKLPRSTSDGHHTWTEDEIEAFEAAHPGGSRERLAMALLLYTGQRRGDVIRLGHQHLRGGVLFLRQEKTGAELSFPLHPKLAEVIAATPRENLTFL